MVVHCLDKEIQAWAMAGMADPMQDAIPAAPSGGKVVASGRKPRWSGQKRSHAAGIQLSLFTR